MDRQQAHDTLLAHPVFGEQFRQYLLTHPKPADCTCDPYSGHTDAVDRGIDVEAIVSWQEEPGICPAERRALARIILSRIRSV